jgi:putative ATP-dependent endonuclease of OLD family
VSDPLRTTSVKATNFKCFGDEPQGFDAILPITLIVGRNNSGKSTLLDLVKYSVNPKDTPLAPFARPGKPFPEVVAGIALRSEEIARVFQNGNSTGDVGDHGTYAKHLVGRKISWKYDDGNRKLVGVDVQGIASANRERFETLLPHVQNPFQQRFFRRLSAERNIVAEPLSAGAEVQPNGVGATQALVHFLTHASRDKTVVTEILLHDLNAILGDDATFADIDTLMTNSGDWEIFLYEEKKGRVALSQSGSGLKTVILILIYIHLLPRLAGATTSRFIYGFEEPENNLHPAVQRRLLRFLRETVEKTSCTMFITTHSSVEIDFFARDEMAQVLHVTHKGGASHVATVSGHTTKRFVLDDLDIRASDILQSNGIVWVEGPSDRIYLNKWIELWAESTLREGAHYQVLFYGGKLLAHLDSVPPEEESETIHILTTNRNVAILIDSDRRNEQDIVNATKQRLVTEVTRARGMAWVTLGREIENYIPGEVLKKTIPLPAAPDRYESVRNTILAANERKLADKVALAQRIAPLLTRNHLKEHLDLAPRLDELVTHIRSWNRA